MEAGGKGGIVGELMDLLLVVIIGFVSVKFEVAQIDKIVFKADSAMLWKSQG